MSGRVVAKLIENPCAVRRKHFASRHDKTTPIPAEGVVRSFDFMSGSQHTICRRERQQLARPTMFERPFDRNNAVIISTVRELQNVSSGRWLVSPEFVTRRD
jgi:hypothetical protein